MIIIYLLLSISIFVKDKKTKDSWPESGSITFLDVSLRYDKDSPPVINKLNFTISSGEKVSNNQLARTISLHQCY